MQNRRLSELVKMWSAGARRQDVGKRVQETHAGEFDELRRKLVDPYEELDRHKHVVLEAIHRLGQSRCATQSKHVQRAKELLESLLQKQ